MTLPTVAILAGGRGTRLMPLTAEKPKCLVEVAGRPFIEWQLERLRDAGITDVVLCLGYRASQVIAAIGDGSRFGLAVRYSLDGDTPLGTSGAIRKALPLLSEPFFVLYGDSYLDIDYGAVYLALVDSGAPALMTVYKADGRDAPNVHYRDEHVLRYNKQAVTGQHLDYGLGMFVHSIFEHPSELSLRFTALYDNLAQVYTFLAETGGLAGYEATKPYHEIGSRAGLQALETKLIEKMPDMPDTHSYIETYLDETIRIAEMMDTTAIAEAIASLKMVRWNAERLFVLGVGGSAANASHAVNDFRKIAAIEAYAPTDNVAELTATTNDVGWDAVFVNWLKTSRLHMGDALLVLSVGGGSLTTSANLIQAMEYANEVGATILAIVSRDGGAAAKLADVCIFVPVVSEARITPHAESWQALIWHLLVNALAQETLYKDVDALGEEGIG